MEAVDEIAEGIERDVLAQSHRHRKPTRPLRPSSACFPIHEPEGRAVHEMECKSRRPPSSPTDSDLPKHSHVGVVATDYPLVERLLNRPDSGPSGPREHTPQPGAPAPRDSPTLYRRHPVFVLNRARNETLGGRPRYDRSPPRSLCTGLAGSIELRRPECVRSTIARRPARMLSWGRASVRHSRAVSTPPVRSVHFRRERLTVLLAPGPGTPSLACARAPQFSTNAIGQGREQDAPAALGEASPERVYGMVGQLAGCGWSIRIPVFGVPAGR